MKTIMFTVFEETLEVCYDGGCLLVHLQFFSPVWEISIVSRELPNEPRTSRIEFVHCRIEASEWPVERRRAALLESAFSFFGVEKCKSSHTSCCDELQSTLEPTRQRDENIAGIAKAVHKQDEPTNPNAFILYL